MPLLTEIQELNKEYLLSLGFHPCEKMPGMDVYAGKIGAYPIEVLLNEHYVQVRISGDIQLANAAYDSGAAICVGLSLVPDDLLNAHWSDITLRLVRAAEILGVTTNISLDSAL